MTKLSARKQDQSGDGADSEPANVRQLLRRRAGDHTQQFFALLNISLGTDQACHSSLT